MGGVSTRFAFKVLAETFNNESAEIGADPVHLMYALEKAYPARTTAEEVEKRYLESIKAVLCRVMQSLLVMRYKKHIWSPTPTTDKTCSTVM